ncbi:MAG: DUF4124 domain-containing protein [Methylococcales bacterium]
MKWLTLVSILLLSHGIPAQQIYKSVDQNGNVSYSSEPAKAAVQVETIASPPTPSPEEVERAQQRYLELEARDARREEERREQELEILLQRQIRADLELKRQIAIANRKPANVTVINQNPYYQYPYFGGGVNQPVWHNRTEPKHLPGPQNPELPKPFGSVNAPLHPKSGTGGGFVWPGNSSGGFVWPENSTRHGRH